jgi:Plant transposon protein
LIYPPYSRFVKGIKLPVTRKEKHYTAWQEASRKDIERAFGVLKCTWQCLGRPFLLQGLEEISDVVACCLLLHNMLVTDRVMASDTYNFRQRYDPSINIEEHGFVADQPADLAPVQNRMEGEQHTVFGVVNAPQQVQQLVTRADRFKELNNKEENQRLHRTIMDVF